MPEFNGITADIITEESVDLYVNYEGLEGLRDNTSRPYSEYFANLITKLDEAQAEKQEPAIEQEPLPGL